MPQKNERIVVVKKFVMHPSCHYLKTCLFPKCVARNRATCSTTLGPNPSGSLQVKSGLNRRPSFRYFSGVTANGILYSDYAKLYYGRMLWKYPDFRERLLRHWTSPDHPHAERFKEWRAEVEKLLASP